MPIEAKRAKANLSNSNKEANMFELQRQEYDVSFSSYQDHAKQISKVIVEELHFLSESQTSAYIHTHLSKQCRYFSSA